MLDPLLTENPALRVYATVALLLVLKIAGVCLYTTYLRMSRRVYATPEDYTLQRLHPSHTRDEDIERVRRAHLNDLENILPFLTVGFLFALTRPSLTVARVFYWGYFGARVLHTVFYVRGKQPHRTIAFVVAGVLTITMVVFTLAGLGTAG